MDKIPVGISACLMGDEVRYNGGHKRDAYINGTLAGHFSFHRLCPEVGIGLGVPRPTLRLIATDNAVRAVRTEDQAFDVTEQLVSYSREQFAEISQLSGLILKRDSPSCGMARVKVYGTAGARPEGRGVFARTVMDQFPCLPVEEEGRLGDPGLRENFIQRVFIYHRWRSDYFPALSVQKLTDFHARHKLIFMSHDQNQCRELGRIAALARPDTLNAVAAEYLSLAMTNLKKIATRKNHLNVLQHIQGYLKKQLDAADKQELIEIFERFERGELPLIVPVTLLQHHFRKSPDEYINRSWYLNPYPAELRLMNLL
ncbi:YbgA family protein [Porticoccus sp.]|uniref:YbgA family protein n=1 Tax=Porticoccus sp. TaxID=2024853 RepID=UPI003F6A0B76